MNPENQQHEQNQENQENQPAQSEICFVDEHEVLQLPTPQETSEEATDDPTETAEASEPTGTSSLEFLPATTTTTTWQLLPDATEAREDESAAVGSEEVIIDRETGSKAALGKRTRSIGVRECSPGGGGRGFRTGDTDTSCWAGGPGLRVPAGGRGTRLGRTLRKQTHPERPRPLAQTRTRPRLDSQSSVSDFEEWPKYIFCKENEHQQRVQMQQLQAYPFLIQHGNPQMVEIDNRDDNHPGQLVQDEFALGDPQQLDHVVSEMSIMNPGDRGPADEEMFICGPLVGLEPTQQELPLESTITWHNTEAVHFNFFG